MYRVKKNGARIGQAFCAKIKYILKFKLKKNSGGETVTENFYFYKPVTGK